MPVVITCSSCGANFSVLEDLIPDGGRAMRCNNCGHHWHGKMGSNPLPPKLNDEASPIPEQKIEETPSQVKVAPPEPQAVAKSFSSFKSELEKSEQEKKSYTEEPVESWDDKLPEQPPQQQQPPPPQQQQQPPPPTQPQQRQRQDSSSIKASSNPQDFSIQSMHDVIGHPRNYVRKTATITKNVILRFLRLILILAVLIATPYGLIRLSCHYQSYIPQIARPSLLSACHFLGNYDKLILPYMRQIEKMATSYYNSYIPSTMFSFKSPPNTQSPTNLRRERPSRSERQIEESPSPRQPVVRRGPPRNPLAP